MKASAFEFRFRFWILVAVFALGFTTPWDYALGRFSYLDGAGPNTHVWGRLAIELSRAGVNIAAAFRALLIAGIVLAFAGAMLRTWATANFGPDTMRGPAMSGGSIPISQNRDPSASSGQVVGHPALVVTGPYRYLRNPLYVGLWLNALALALLMPPSGAIFLLVLLAVFQLRLILAEEAWLGERLGAGYMEYCAKVPRIVPRFRTEALKGDPAGPGVRWGKAALAEIFLWGVAISFAALGWQYNAHLLIQCVLVSLGLGLVVRGVAK